MNINRRNALILTAAASATSFGFISSPLAAPGHSGAEPVPSSNGKVFDLTSLMNPKGWTDRAILGSAEAPATLIEYTSPTCPFCAAFHNDTYPALKSEFIETGKTRFIVRPFIRNVLDAVVFMLADAAGDEMYHDVIASYFSTQHIWAQSDTPRDALLEVALNLGFTEESFENTLTNQTLFAGLEQVRNQALDEFELTGTPTFYINGKMLSGNKTLEEFATEINSLQG